MRATAHRQSTEEMLSMNICDKLFWEFERQVGDERKWKDSSSFVLGKEKKKQGLRNQLNKLKRVFWDWFLQMSCILDGTDLTTMILYQMKNIWSKLLNPDTNCINFPHSYTEPVSFILTNKYLYLFIFLFLPYCVHWFYSNST